jgi:hypothetical protein
MAKCADLPAALTGCEAFKGSFGRRTKIASGRMPPWSLVVLHLQPAAFSRTTSSTSSDATGIDRRRRARGHAGRPTATPASARYESPTYTVSSARTLRGRECQEDLAVRLRRADDGRGHDEIHQPRDLVRVAAGSAAGRCPSRDDALHQAARLCRLQRRDGLWERLPLRLPAPAVRAPRPRTRSAARRSGATSRRAWTASRPERAGRRRHTSPGVLAEAAEERGYVRKRRPLLGVDRDADARNLTSSNCRTHERVPGVVEDGGSSCPWVLELVPRNAVISYWSSLLRAPAPTSVCPGRRVDRRQRCRLIDRESADQTRGLCDRARRRAT